MKILSQWILSFEGGYVNHPLDKGGPTNRGVTLSTWRAVGYDKDGDGDIDAADVRLITDSDMATCVLAPHYWRRWRGDDIRSQSVANIVVDWVWASGVHGITGVQRILGVKADGIAGDKTIAALNAREPRALFEEIKRARRRFIGDIVRRSPSQKVFLKGWLRRLDSLGYGFMTLNDGRVVRFCDI